MIPIVGLTTYVARATYGPFEARAALTPTDYVDLVSAAGGRPVLLPPAYDHPAGPGAAAVELIDHLDALVVIGGLDVDPSLYDAARHAETGRSDPVRDASELALLRAALEADLPLLCICRGHQLLNVALGGTLHQHVPELVGHVEHQPSTGVYQHRGVRLQAGSTAARVFGEEPVVSCSHHQVVDRLGAGLVASGWSVEAEGTQPVVEAMEHPGSSFCLSVQWHPEWDADGRPFAALVEAARTAVAREG